MCYTLRRGKLLMFALSYCLMVLGQVHAQDTLALSIDRADELFLQKNLYLLAAQLNIDAQKAILIQSKSYPNPNFSGEVNLYDPENKKLLHAGATGEKIFAVEQLILLGGKRKNQIELARQNSEQAQLQLADLLSNLRHQLHVSMYTVFFNQRAMEKYNVQLAILDTLIENYSIQAQKGNIAVKEVVRLKSMYIQVNNNKTELISSIVQEQRNLNMLLQTKSYLMPQITIGIAYDRLANLPALDSLEQLALRNRSDLKLATLQTDIKRTNLKLQQSLAVPDFTVGANYDQRGGAFNRQSNLTFAIPLPLWNRNKGGISQAKNEIKQADLNQEITVQAVLADVQMDYLNLLRSMQEYRKINELFGNDFTEVFQGMMDNFRRRNISMLEFIDFFESYSNTEADVFNGRKQLLISGENLNQSTATPIF